MYLNVCNDGFLKVVWGVLKKESKFFKECFGLVELNPRVLHLLTCPIHIPV